MKKSEKLLSGVGVLVAPLVYSLLLLAIPKVGILLTVLVDPSLIVLGAVGPLVVGLVYAMMNNGNTRLLGLTLF